MTSRTPQIAKDPTISKAFRDKSSLVGTTTIKRGKITGSGSEVHRKLL